MSRLGRGSVTASQKGPSFSGYFTDKIVLYNVVQDARASPALVIPIYSDHPLYALHTAAAPAVLAAVNT